MKLGFALPLGPAPSSLVRESERRRASGWASPASGASALSTRPTQRRARPRDTGPTERGRPAAPAAPSPSARRSLGHVEGVPVPEVGGLDAGREAEPGRHEDQHLREQPEAVAHQRRAAPAETADAPRQGAEVEGADEGQADDREHRVPAGRDSGTPFAPSRKRATAKINSNSREDGRSAARGRSCGPPWSGGSCGGSFGRTSLHEIVPVGPAGGPGFPLIAPRRRLAASCGNGRQLPETLRGRIDEAGLGRANARGDPTRSASRGSGTRGRRASSRRRFRPSAPA